MSNPKHRIKVADWVERAKTDPVTYRQRQTIEIILNSIAMTAPLDVKMFLKGGILMGLAYDSPRQTSDINLTTYLTADGDVDNEIQRLLDSVLPRAATELGYADLIVRTHSVKRLPKKPPFEEAKFPGLELKIACTRRGTREETALLKGKGTNVIKLEISFNEPLRQFQVLELTGGQELRAYSLGDLIAEKYRAILQQVKRKRNRRQDVYDLDLLIVGNQMDDSYRAQILDAFIEKCRARHINPTRTSLDDPEIKKRSGTDWQTMELELGEVPDFEDCFARVSQFYRDLPWQIERTTEE